jgi:hypothetical protein
MKVKSSMEGEIGARQKSKDGIWHFIYNNNKYNKIYKQLIHFACRASDLLGLSVLNERLRYNSRWRRALLFTFSLCNQRKRKDLSGRTAVLHYRFGNARDSWLMTIRQIRHTTVKHDISIRREELCI